ncbi:MAG TPA: hypothetical protein VMT14_22825, partial [Burkholderiaceae bacterium]|nr:hypothetical protein [Burkholderiaceae bacterium]
SIVSQNLNLRNLLSIELLLANFTQKPVDSQVRYPDDTHVAQPVHKHHVVRADGKPQFLKVDAHVTAKSCTLHADVFGHGRRLKQPDAFCLIDLMLVERVVLLRDFKES